MLKRAAQPGYAQRESCVLFPNIGGGSGRGKGNKTGIRPITLLGLAAD
jgi:hypothetical protein